jgi:hypothetical protein
MYNSNLQHYTFYAYANCLPIFKIYLLITEPEIPSYYESNLYK